MPRNVLRDERESQRRRRQLIEAGFSLFSVHGIESVSLQSVAEAANVGAATMYKYYQNKTNLVIAISAAMWEDVWIKCSEHYSLEALQNATAYRLVEIYCDIMIKLYREHPQMLCFSANYKTYIRRERASDDQLKVQMEALQPINALFLQKFRQADQDHSIRTDIPPEEMLTTVTLTMLAMAERYAQGIVWTDNSSRQHEQELVYLKDMLLSWCAKK